MAITIVGTPQSGSAVDGADVTLTFDGSPAEDDLVVLIGGNADNDGSGAIGPSTGGYTQQILRQTATEAYSGGIWTKRLGASPDSSVVGQGSGDVQEATAYVSVVLRGVDTSTEIDASAIQYVFTSGSMNPSAITTVTDGALVIVGYIVSGLFGALNETSTGYGNLTTAHANDTRAMGAALQTKEVATAGLEDPDEWDSDYSSGVLWTIAIRPATGSSTSLYATADGTLTNLVDEADLTTGLFDSIDDDPASPTDTDWVNNSSATGSGFFDITDMPAGFGTADTAEIVVRYRGQNFGSGTVTLYAQLFQSDESTSLSNEVQVAQVTGNGSFANTSAVTFTGLNTTAGKAVWDAARVRLRWATT